MNLSEALEMAIGTLEVAADKAESMGRNDMAQRDNEAARILREYMAQVGVPVPTAQDLYRYLIDEVNVQRAFDARLTYPAALSIAMHKAVDKFGLTMEPTRENHDHRHHD